MAISLKHAKTSTVPDVGDSSLVQPSDWNDEHTLTQATDRILGRVTSGAGATEELTAAEVRTLLNLATVATTGAYSDLSGVPSLATVATSGDYDDLTNKPTLGALAALDDLSSFDTGDLGEGTNLYFTDERAQDAVGTILADSSEIDFTYSDGTPSITAALKSGSIDETKLDTSVNASLDLADSAVQPGDSDASALGWVVDEDDMSSDSATKVPTQQSVKAYVDANGGGLTEFAPASASGPASLDFAEDTDNGTNKITVTAPASIDSDKTLTLPNATDTLVGKATTDTLTNKTLTDPVITGAISEDIYEITDGAGFEIDPSNGSIQYVTLGADRTPAATNFANGESVTLHVDDGSARTITWTTVDVNWVGGSAPTLATTGWTVIELWKWGGQIFGANPGDVAA